MKQKTHYAQRPENIEIFNVGGIDLIYVRENISEETSSDSESEVTEYVADEYLLSLPHPAMGSYEEYLSAAKQKEYDNAASLVRKRRDDLIAQTDYYALSDRDMPENIKEYRQKLRDIPEQPGFPYEVEFPKI